MVHFDEDKQNLKLKEIHDRQEEDFLRTIADKMGVPFINLYPSIIESDALATLPEEKAVEGKIIPFKLNVKNLSLAIKNPNSEITQKIITDLVNQGYSPIIHLISENTFKRCLEAYKDISKAKKTDSRSIDISADSISESIQTIKEIKDANNAINDTVSKKEPNYISKILEIIMGGAIALSASDVHLEVEAEDTRIRYRLDGELYDATRIPTKIYNLLLSRIKLISGLKLNIQKESQDGRFSIKISDRDIEIRVSIVPGGFGESIVMRLLDPKSINVPFESIGISKYLMPVIETALGKPKGMILTTGPTGSGKTTTLYGFMRKVYNPETKIMTIEDPIEYRLQGIVQTQADDKSGYSFDSGLRAALRQDPDVIMVGEIRDEETAKTAINAALTGHLVFSTLHTNNAAGAFTRLIDLKINPKVLSSALTVALAQRLVRKLCDCKKEIPLEGENKKTIDEILNNLPKGIEIAQREKIWQAVGCDKCHNSGYKGRIGVYEAIISDSAIEKVIQENPSEREIKNAGRPQGIPDMREDVVLKILDGITSIEEAKNKIDLSPHQ